MNEQRPGRDHRVAGISAVVLGAALLALAFFGGTRLAPAPVVRSSATTVVHTPIATPTSTSAAPLTAGTHLWSELRGGECLGAYTSAWQVEYVVVDCAVAHPAQLLRRVALEGDAYPGATSLAGTLSLACQSAKTVAVQRAATYSGLRIAFSYPTESQWASGIRFGSCFVSRTGARTFTGSLAAG